MDLTQRKLSRAEWDSIEVPVNTKERDILRLICDGFSDINITKNTSQSMIKFIKIDPSVEMDEYLYQKYFEPIIQDILEKYPVISWQPKNYKQLKKMKSIDMLRIQNMDTNIQTNKEIVYEFVVLELCKNMAKYYSKKKSKYAFYLYTLVQLKKANIENVNPLLMDFVYNIVDYVSEQTNLTNIVKEATLFIEQNKNIMEYENKTLFPHQKQLFSQPL